MCGQQSTFISLWKMIYSNITEEYWQNSDRGQSFGEKA